MLYVVDGAATLDTDDSPRPFGAGSLARFDGAELLQVSNRGQANTTLLAFLAPPFPPS